jgi:hypothetical protein
MFLFVQWTFGPFNISRLRDEGPGTRVLANFPNLPSSPTVFGAQNI